jgi:hypothetical protein
MDAFCLEITMQEYEFRVLNSDKSVALIMEEVALSDHAAIRSAQRVAHGRAIEVWRGLSCIYDGAAAAMNEDTSRPAA